MDFSKIKTFSCLPAPEKAGVNEFTMKNITFLVNKQMQAKDFTMTTDNPDLAEAVTNLLEHFPPLQKK